MRWSADPPIYCILKSVVIRFALAGRLSKSQIKQGYAILQQLSDAIEELADRSATPPLVPKVVPPPVRGRGGGGRGRGRGGKARAVARGRQALASNAITIRELQGRLKALSSDFYSTIPHSFVRSLPPTLDSMEAVKEKMDLLEVLGNVRISRELEASEVEKLENAERSKRPPHPLSMRYNALRAIVEPLDESDEEFKVIQR